MRVLTVATRPIAGQEPGTSGLRKTTRAFMEPGYLENFVQSVFDTIGGLEGKTLVLGGDGRYFTPAAARTILFMAAANGADRVVVGREGLLSTPAASCLIRRRGAAGGLLLTASHNPGGPDADFGIKVNMANGGPAPVDLTAQIYERTKTIDAYRILDGADIAFGQPGTGMLGGMTVEVVDPVENYRDLMAGLFDFEAIRSLFEGGFRMRFDALNAVTGPYARRLFEEELGASRGTVVNATPLADFGGLHPDPNPLTCRDLVTHMMSPQAPDLAAATDGDGDRAMILGRGVRVSPGDSLAVLAARADLVPGYRGGLAGVARSMPTSRAVDRVAASLGIDCHETPTGWKFFGTLLDAGKVTLCGEESAGTGSSHMREKDGLWAVLFWLNIIARRRLSVAGILEDHWRRFGRHYHSRHDWEGLPPGVAGDLVESLRSRLPRLPGSIVAGLTVTAADEFHYTDPIDGTTARNQGLRIAFEGGMRVVLRLSGTSTGGAILRVYLERYEADESCLHLDCDEALTPLAAAADAIAGIRARTGRRQPDVRT
ncbi:MAG: alpha-D-glucose phosphate-specific phosphoglucomutase [Alphaproteobacteria bacterium]|nr:alpha-D-glucose phosphate-specific phosphoglucomutase [Alphaproteobacteria bacterium]